MRYVCFPRPISWLAGPTVGLYPLDVRVLIMVLQRLLDQGAAVVGIAVPTTAYRGAHAL